MDRGNAQEGRPVIFVGGVNGFSSLADPSATTKLRATSRVALYQHTNAIVSAVHDGSLPAIVRNFRGTGGGEAELPFIAEHADQWFHTWFRNMFQDRGLRPTDANVNFSDYTKFNDPAFFQSWQAYVDAARSVGIKTVAPLFTPNTLFQHIDTFEDPIWNGLRKAALYGGALGFDAPPHFFFQREQRYRDFVIEEVRWTRRHNLRATVLISPNVSRQNFLSDTKQYVQALKDADAIPTNWVVENYEAKTPYHWPNVVGREDQPDTVTSIALWLADNLPSDSTDRR